MMSVSGGDGGDNKQSLIIGVTLGIIIIIAIIIIIIIALLLYKKRFAANNG